ncbi:PREDICTED: uncharacterized protein LOC104743614 [Camelina sativa]|uniref:Uncharacterized protein LOC104743614 n=1 Tax=Camelina sativa TaxID=90675 RepID=A0ABM0VYA4_CAMSA|nr:PREDICTED: uncharacterized protein LOC104743614 [Camelina sativa]
MQEHSRVDDNPIITGGMRDFQAVFTHCSLSDIASHGPLFTWCNKRENDLIHKKLDRVLVNAAWEQLYPYAYNVFAAGGCYDHLNCRIMVKGEGDNHGRRRKPFKFVNLLTEMEEFLPLKLKGLKPALRSLAKRRLGNLVLKTREAFDVLCEKQQANSTNPSSLAMEEENAAFKRWDFLVGLEEKFLKQKSKLHLLKVGDKNNTAFHRAATIQKAQNTIKEIHCSDGRMVKKEEEIKTEAERHFPEFLQLIPPDFEGSTVEELERLLPFRCSVVDQQALTRVVSGEEIKKVLFSMLNDKSPRPDGFTSEFYKSTWELLGAEFVLAVQSFFAKGFLPKGINSTILALIPKKVSTMEMKDYRPISCCNVIYKVISKIIANRLKRVLPKFVSVNQSTFVKDRLLIENVLLTTELIKNYHKDSLSGRCAIKIDISKAFDSFQWSFLSKVLSAVQFPPTFIHWIMFCVTTTSFSVQVNGELAGFFRSSWGLSQGCSLSPYLFVICMDVLSKLLDKAAGDRLFGYHPRCQNLGLTHLSFADDLMVLYDGKVRSIEGIVEVFTQFSKMSGLSISMEKSTLYVVGNVPPLDTADSHFLLGLSRECITEINSLCSAFLWSGTELNSRKAKVAWEEVFKPRTEGGLGLRSLQEANTVCCLKLIWRLVSNGESLWVQWAHTNLLKGASFWSVKSTLTLGSWIWTKLLKYRDMAKGFCKVEVGTGEHISFWFDNWSDMGMLSDVVGERGVIELGIPWRSSLAEAWAQRPRRRHRADHLNAIEDAMRMGQQQGQQ